MVLARSAPNVKKFQFLFFMFATATTISTSMLSTTTTRRAVAAAWCFQKTPHPRGKLSNHRHHLLLPMSRMMNLHSSNNSFHRPVFQPQEPSSSSIRLYSSKKYDIASNGAGESNSDDHDDASFPRHSFRRGDKVQVEVVNFGPLGASVEVIGLGHGPQAQYIIDADDAEPLGFGLVLQKEIAYFRAARNNVDVVRGEILPGWVQAVRDEDGKLDIGLRPFGGKGKAEDLGSQIMERLEEDGIINVGDKSSPEDIQAEFPGASKGAFKKAVGALYKKGLIQPGPSSVKLVQK